MKNIERNLLYIRKKRNVKKYVKCLKMLDNEAYRNNKYKDENVARLVDLLTEVFTAALNEIYKED